MNFDAEDFYDDDYDPSREDYDDFGRYDPNEPDTEQEQLSYRLILKLRRASTLSYLRGISFQSTEVPSFDDAHKQAKNFVDYKYPGWKISEYRSAN